LKIIKPVWLLEEEVAGNISVAALNAQGGLKKPQLTGRNTRYRHKEVFK
jgi:hypothetical protein